METAARYHAFLSYSHADEALAGRLHRALETYVLPRHLRQTHGLPRRLAPIFRDVDELEASSSLELRLRDALDTSRWLIVLCSPAAARSRYVNAEIEHFIGRHGSDRVLCALAAGEPPHCFPPALRASGSEPLAADFRDPAAFESAKLKLLAAVAGLRYTELRDRDAQRHRRLRAALATMLAAIVAGALGGWDLLHRPQTRYYADFTRVHGIWQGIRPLSAQEARSRDASYRFVHHGRLRPPLRVDYVNAGGYCSGYGFENLLGETRGADLDWARPPLRYCSAQFEYADDGTLRLETLLNLHGAPLESLTYTGDGLAQFTREGFASANARSGIYYVQFERDAQGRDRSRRYLHSRGNPRSNDEGAFGHRYEYDDGGRMLSRTPLDSTGAVSGPAAIHRYDTAGWRIETRWQDPGGALVPGPEGAAYQRWTRDASGNVLRLQYLDASGAPIVATPGHAAVVYQRDVQGHVLLELYRDADDQPMAGPHSYAGIAWRYDDLGRPLRMEFLDEQQRRLAPGGEPVVEYTYDAVGRIVEARHVDAEGRVAEGALGYAIARGRYDERGLLIEQAFFDAEGRPARTRWGATIRLPRNERGDVIGFLLFDAQGRPWVRHETGAAATHIKRDERGNPVEISYLGADLQPTLRRGGYALMRTQYDEAGNAVERSLFGLRGEPITSDEGYAGYRSRYDRSGGEIERRYYAVDGRPTTHVEEGYGWNAEYDTRARLLRRIAIDAGGHPSATPSGHAETRYEYDLHGRVTVETHLDARGQFRPPPAFARLRYEWDVYSNEIGRRYEDAAGQPTRGPAGCAALLTRRDRHANVVGEHCLDARGQPTAHRDGGWATRTYERKRGAVVTERRYDAAGRELPTAAAQPPG